MCYVLTKSQHPKPSISWDSGGFYFFITFSRLKMSSESKKNKKIQIYLGNFAILEIFSWYFSLFFV